MPASWGSVARRGTRQLSQEGAGPASLAWREAVARARGEDDGRERSSEVWIRDEEPAVPARTRDAAPGPRAPGARPRPRPAKLPQEVGTELADQVGSGRAPRLTQRLAEATRDYERERYRDAVKILKPLADEAPGSPAVRELYGLTRYRLGHWHEAIKELEALRTLSGTYDQHPTLADCYRATKRWAKVEELWEDLRRASPGPDLVTEGRIVAAGALADRGRVAEAIDRLDQGKPEVRRPKPHHLRLWYALGDLYERAGDLTKARHYFRRVLDADPELYDTAERLAAIG
ncbi:MAG TPA: tetratricopeptide repeat protein [Acidimicrobiales bacterium]|nr:tetratricopeptide repeat protein [Acidimicrobiales bacterium]